MVEGLVVLGARLGDRIGRLERAAANGAPIADIFPGIREIEARARTLADAAAETSKRLEERVAVVRNSAGRQPSLDLAAPAIAKPTTGG